MLTIGLQFRRQKVRFLPCPRGKSIYKWRRKAIIRLQTHSLKIPPHLTNLLRMESLLNNRAHKRRKLGFIPALLIRKLHIHENQALKRMVLLNTTEEMNTAVLTGVALNGCGFIDDSEFTLIGYDAEIVFRDNGYNGEEYAFRLPAF